MKIGSVLENQKTEKRISITPEIAKKYKSIGLDVYLSKNYGSHLGISDEEYKNMGVKFSDDEKEIINLSNIIVQLGLLSDDKSSLKSIKKRDLNSKLVRRRGRVYIINKTNPNLKQDKNNFYG